MFRWLPPNRTFSSGFNRPRRAMQRDPIEVLRRKEAELERLQEEVRALRLVGKLLRDQSAPEPDQATRGKILQMP
jgi:hypothetical protein